MKIKDIEFPGRAFLAPMAGVADRAFREVCASFGAAYTVTEMVSAKGLSMGDKKKRRSAYPRQRRGHCGHADFRR